MNELFNALYFHIYYSLEIDIINIPYLQRHSMSFIASVMWVVHYETVINLKCSKQKWN